MALVDRAEDLGPPRPVVLPRRSSQSATYQVDRLPDDDIGMGIAGLGRRFGDWLGLVPDDDDGQSMPGSYGAPGEHVAAETTNRPTTGSLDRLQRWRFRPTLEPGHESGSQQPTSTGPRSVGSARR